MKRSAIKAIKAKQKFLVIAQKSGTNTMRHIKVNSISKFQAERDVELPSGFIIHEVRKRG